LRCFPTTVLELSPCAVQPLSACFPYCSCARGQRVLKRLAAARAPQAMTGVKPDDTCAASFEELKSKKTHRFILYTITADGKHISKVAAEAPAGTCEEDWGKFAGVLTGEYATKCCYAVFDFDWTAEDGHDAQKIMFVLWSPEGAKVKDKMMTTGSKDALKRALVGVGQDFQATDASEIEYSACLEKAKSAVKTPPSFHPQHKPLSYVSKAELLTASIICWVRAQSTSG
jgi:cofilin